MQLSPLNPDKLLSLGKNERVYHPKPSFIKIIAQDIPLDPVISTIPNEFIKKVIQFLKKWFGNMNTKNWKRYKSWGSNRDLITVTLPKRDKFLCLQQLRVCSILASLGIKLSSYKELMFKEKLIPNVLKELDFHFRPTSSNGQESLPFKLPFKVAWKVVILVHLITD